MNRPRHKLLKPLIFIACIPLTIFLITAALALSFGETPSLEAMRFVLDNMLYRLTPIPFLVIMVIITGATASLLRMLLEDLGVLESEDTWHDWRTEPADLPPGAVTGTALDASPPGLLDPDEWPHRSRLVKYHRPARAKRYPIRY